MDPFIAFEYEGRKFNVRAIRGAFQKGEGEAVWMIHPGKEGIELKMGK